MVSIRLTCPAPSVDRQIYGRLVKPFGPTGPAPSKRVLLDVRVIKQARSGSVCRPLVVHCLPEPESRQPALKPGPAEAQGASVVGSLLQTASFGAACLGAAILIASDSAKPARDILMQNFANQSTVILALTLFFGGGAGLKSIGDREKKISEEATWRSKVDSRLEAQEKATKNLGDKIEERTKALDDKIDERTKALDDKIEERTKALDDKIEERTKALEGKIDTVLFELRALSQTILISDGNAKLLRSQMDDARQDIRELQRATWPVRAAGGKSSTATRGRRSKS